MRRKRSPAATPTPSTPRVLLRTAAAGAVPPLSPAASTPAIPAAGALRHTLRRLLVAVGTVLALVFAWVGATPGQSQAAAALPCDIYAAAGSPCVAAHSTVRALYGAYAGPLYQVTRASDGAARDIGLLTAGGYADAAAQDAFCAATSCTITRIYDQSPRHNDLTVEGAGTAGAADHGALATALPLIAGGHRAYGVLVTPGTGYRHTDAAGVAVNGAPESMYMVASGTHVNGGCCFDYGNAEHTISDTGNGHMDAVYIGTRCHNPPCTGTGPWVAADLENGLYQGSGNNPADLGNATPFVTALLKNDGRTSFALKGGDARSGALSTWWNGPLPSGGYTPMQQEGSIVLGTGGDNSNASAGSFYEGVMTSGWSTDAADAAVQANIVAAGYTGGGDGTSGATITGPGGACVDVDGDDVGADHAAVQLWQCQSWAVDQHWTHAADNSLVTLGRCLDIMGNATAAGTKVQLWDCNGVGGQKWVQQADGSLRNPQSGRCLDSPSGATANGTRLQIWDCNGSAAQRFTLHATTAATAAPASATAVPPSATTATTAADAAPAAPADAPAWYPPLSTQGRYIVDAHGDRFRLKAANWDGAQGSWTGSGDIADPANHHAGQDSYGIPLGLDRVPLAQLMSDFHAVGVNSIRLPFSNEMIHSTTPVPDRAVAANPRLRGDTPLQVYDAVVGALSDSGFAVILNNHTTTSRWCCGLDGNERWNTSQSTGQWADDWVFMARRYASVPGVVGADLYNEVRRDVLDDPNWGLGDDHDWYAAARLAGDRILTEANPRLLIVVEGINWTGLPVDGLPHGRPMLTPVRTLSQTLVDSHKLVYSAHFYGYTGPHHSGATGIGETHDLRYRDMTREQLGQALDDEAFFVEQPGQHFTAPVWVSEFGAGADDTDAATRAWFGAVTDYFADHDADFAYWPLVGYQGHDTWALLSYDTAGNRAGILDPGDWRAAGWQHLMADTGVTGPVAPVPVWRMLSTDHGDAVESLRARAAGDWDPGAYKAACPDGLRLIGLSHDGGRGLCTDAGAPDPRAADGGQTVVTDERYVPPGGDWASGYTKLQCPAGDFLIGYSLRGQRVSAALCAPGRTALAGAGRTVWFDRSDTRPADAPGGDFAVGHYKGQCGQDEYAAGIAFTTRVGSGQGPAALMCRALDAS